MMISFSHVTIKCIARSQEIYTIFNNCVTRTSTDAILYVIPQTWPIRFFFINGNHCLQRWLALHCSHFHTVSLLNTVLGRPLNFYSPSVTRGIVV